MRTKEKSLLEEIFREIEINIIYSDIIHDVDKRAFHQNYCEFLTNTRKYINKSYKLHYVSLNAQSVIYHKWSERIKKLYNVDCKIKNGDIHIYDFAIITKEYKYLENGERLSYSIYVYNIDYTIDETNTKRTNSGYYIEY